MKKIISIITLLLCLHSFSQENELNVGVNGGVTVGNLEAVSSIAFGVEGNYLFDIFDGISVGPSLNFLYFVSKENTVDSNIYIPIGGAVRFNSFEEQFYVGLDLGYAIGISPEGDDGGVFFKPLLGYEVTDAFKINLFYSAVKKNSPTYSYVGLGVTYDVFSNRYNNF
ncbi:hypothetical protein [Tenacibaculum agarivorans]|uniref:hypothetical protein n=1 Tax=Tenacibaculum agarivorans TaxID=1908389 RepID=UPI00094B93A7|nr:hypothetical protein [Tenacibaculum agarivorans]